MAKAPSEGDDRCSLPRRSQESPNNVAESRARREPGNDVYSQGLATSRAKSMQAARVTLWKEHVGSDRREPRAPGTDVDATAREQGPANTGARSCSHDTRPSSCARPTCSWLPAAGCREAPTLLDLCRRDRPKLALGRMVALAARVTVAAKPVGRALRASDPCDGDPSKRTRRHRRSVGVESAA